MVHTPVEIPIGDRSQVDRQSFSNSSLTTREQATGAEGNERTGLLEAALSAAGMGILEWDLHTGAIYCSAHFLQTLGIHGFSGSFTDFERFLQKSDIHRLVSAMTDAIESKGQVSLDFSIGSSERSMHQVTFVGCCEYQSENSPSRLIGTLQRRVRRNPVEASQESAETRNRARPDVPIEGCLILDSELRYIYVNSHAERQIGRTASELVGKRIDEVFPGIESAEIYSAIRRCRVEMTTCQLKLRSFFPDGPVGDYVVDILPTVGGVVVVSRENAERKCVEGILHQNEMRLKTAEQVANLGIWEWDLGDCFWCSDGLCQILGCDSRTCSMSLSTLMEHIPETDKADLQTAIRRTISLNVPYQLVHRIVRADGKERWIDSHGFLEQDANSRPVRLWGVCQDITERRLTEVESRVGEQRLRESEERYRLALDAAEQGSWKYDHLTQGLWIDERCREQNGFESVRPNRQNALEMLHPEDARRLFEEGKRAQVDPERDGSFSAEYRIHRPDGSLRWISLAARIQFDESSTDRMPLQIHGTTRDVTQRKRAEAIVQRQSVVLEQIAIGAPLASILQKVVDLVEEQVPGTYGAIYIADLKQNRLLFTAGNSLPADYCRAVQFVPIGPEEGTCGTAAYLKQKVVVSDISQDPLWFKYRDLASEFGLVACSSTPIMDTQENGDGLATGNVLGTLCLYRKGPPGLNTEADEIVATAVHLAKLAIERENAFLALRECEARYSAISEITRSVTFAFRYAADGTVKIEWVRPRFGLLSGYSEEECDQFGWKILFRPEDHERLERLFRKVAKGRSVRDEFQLVTKAGDALTVLVQGRLLRPASEANDGIIVGGLLDITELKSVEVALRESEERFQLAMRGANDGLWDWNLTSQEVYFSPRWKTMLGYAEEELVDRISTWLQLLHPNDVAEAKSVVVDFLNGDSEIYESTFRKRHKTGEYRTILSRGFTLRDDRGVPVRMVGTHQDITDRMLADQELRTSRQQLQTLSRQLISTREEELRHLARELHDEIGQQLTLMKMNLRNVQRSADETIRSRLDENISMIEQAVEQVRNLSLNMRPPHLDDLGLVATLHWYLKKQAALAGFQERLTVVPSEIRVPTDLATVCFRITQEAVTNAIRHARPVSIEIELRCEEGMLRLMIRDDGCGFNVADARKRALEGTSLGIISMQERAKLAGGETEITSKIGQGTEVCARFPLKSS